MWKLVSQRSSTTTKTWIHNPGLNRLKDYQEDGLLQSLAEATFDFQMNDDERFNFLFANEGNIKKSLEVHILELRGQQSTSGGEI